MLHELFTSLRNTGKQYNLFCKCLVLRICSVVVCVLLEYYVTVAGSMLPSVLRMLQCTRRTKTILYYV